MARSLGNLTLDLVARTGSFTAPLTRAEAQIRSTSNSFQKAANDSSRAAARQNEAIKSVAGSISNYAKILAGSFAVGNVIQQADAWNQVNARLKLATTSTEDYTTAQQALFQLSQKTGTAFGDNATLFARSASSMRQYGYDTEQVLQVTESVATALQLSGSTASETSSVITQLSQAFGSGVLRGEEFNSVNENGIRLMKALADGLGVAQGELKGMAENGLLTIDKIVPAITSQVGKLRGEFETFPRTVSRSTQELSNAFQQWIGGADGASGSTAALSSVISVAAENIDTLASVLLSAGAGYAAMKTTEVALGLKAQAAAAIQTASAERSRAAAVVASADAQLVFARSLVVEAEASVAASTGMRRLTLVQNELIPRQAAATAAANAHAAALSRLSVAGSSAKALLGVFGGPLGLGLTVAATAASFLLLGTNADESKRSLEDMGITVDNLTDKWREANEEQRKAISSALSDDISKQEDKIKNQIRTIQGWIKELSGSNVGDFFFAEAINSNGDLDALAQSVTNYSEETKKYSNFFQAWIGTLGNAVGKQEQLRQKQAELNNELGNTANQANMAGNALRTVSIDPKQMQSNLNYLSSLQNELLNLTDKSGRAGFMKGLADRGVTETDPLYKTFVATWEMNQKLKKDAGDTRSYAKQTSAIDSTIDSLKEQVATLGMTEEQVQLYKLQVQGASEAQLKMAQSYLATVKAFEDNKIFEQQSKEQARFIADMNAQIQSVRESGAIDVLGIGMSDRDRELMEKEYDIRKKNRDAIADLNRRQEDETTRITEGQYNERLRIIQEKEAAELQVLKESDQAKREAQGNWLLGANKAWEDYRSSAEDVAGNVQGIFQNAFTGMEDVVVQFVTTGKASFRDFAISVLSDIARIATRMTIVNAFSGLFGSGAASQSDILGFMGSFASGYADGGYTGAGGVLEPAGVVHRGEVVFSQRDVAKHGGVGAVEAIRRGLPGYADGGIVDYTQRLREAGQQDIQRLSGANTTSITVNAPVTIQGSDASLSKGQADATGQAVKVVVRTSIEKELRPGGMIDTAIKRK